MSRSTYQHPRATETKTKLPPLAECYPSVKPDPSERHTFFVKSDSNAHRDYRVFLDAFHWNGLCQCQRFEFKHMPKLQRGALPSDFLRCKHIKEARAYYLDEIGRRMDELNQPRNNPKNGDTLTCQLCKKLIKFAGGTWKHLEIATHPALP